MNCQEALDHLYQIIDKEASQVDEQTIREHLSHCTDCCDLYRIEQAVNDFIMARLKSDQSKPDLSALKKRVLEELDTSDCEDPCSD